MEKAKRLEVKDFLVDFYEVEGLLEVSIKMQDETAMDVAAAEKPKLEIEKAC